MADKNETKSIESIKEMESNIASELSKKVTLVQSDPRADGSVQMNPEFDRQELKPNVVTNPAILHTPPGAPASSQAPPLTVAENKIEDMSLDEVNSLLNEVDEGFAENMKAIKEGLDGVQMAQPLESITIGADYLKGDDAKNEEIEKDIIQTKSVVSTPKVERKTKFWSAVGRVSLSLSLLPVDLATVLTKQVLLLKSASPKEVFKGLVPALKHPIILRAQHFNMLFQVVLSYKKVRLAKSVGLILLMFVLLYIGRDIVRNTTRKIETDPFLKSFEEVAGTKTSVTTTEKMDENNEEKNTKKVTAPVPEFVVALPRLIANLKSSHPRSQPMGAVELYVAMSNRESAIEIKNRENEVRDLVARTIEEMTFDELDTAEGKEKLKTRLRLAINHILNNGRVARLYFKSIQVSY